MSDVSINIKRLPSGQGLALPQQATEFSAGVDLLAAISQPVTLKVGQLAVIPTGISVAIPVHHEGQVRARSGLALHHGIILPNGVGTIDSDYRGEIHVILANSGVEPFTIERGMRIAQMIVAPVCKPVWVEVDELEDTSRADGGFGHTGH